jgi:hypothetical protein
VNQRIALNLSNFRECSRAPGVGEVAHEHDRGRPVVVGTSASFVEPVTLAAGRTRSSRPDGANTGSSPEAVHGSADLCGHHAGGSQTSSQHTPGQNMKSFTAGEPEGQHQDDQRLDRRPVSGTTSP